MTNYRRNIVPGATYFFTVNLADRRSHLLVDEIEALRAAFRIVRGRYPFSLDAIAVLPDHPALGVQAAYILFDLADNNWILPPDVQVQLPLSTTTTLDFVQVRSRFSLRGDALQHVDRILE